MKTKNRKAKIANYYNLKEKQNKLYAKSKMGAKFKYLMKIVPQPENTKMAYRQLWTLDIRDTKLLQVIKRMLKAPIRMPDGQTEIPTEDTARERISLPLLANVV